jgi:hypothetical protein
MIDFFVIDDVIPNKFQNEIEKVLGDKFPWYHKNEAVYFDVKNKNIPKSDNAKATPFFVHNFSTEEGVVSEFYNFIYPMLYFVEEKFNIDIKSIIRSKANLLMQRTGYTKEDHSFPHVDQLVPHMVLLYYVNDSDGDTIFFDKKYDATKVTSEVELEVAHRVSPKKGRAILFNGLLYHASSNPIDSDKRIVLNFNIEV